MPFLLPSPTRSRHRPSTRAENSVGTEPKSPSDSCCSFGTVQCATTDRSQVRTCRSEKEKSLVPPPLGPPIGTYMSPVRSSMVGVPQTPPPTDRLACTVPRAASSLKIWPGITGLSAWDAVETNRLPRYSRTELHRNASVSVGMRLVFQMT